MYSSRMRTAHLLSVSPSMHSSRKCTWSGGYTWSRGVYLVPGGVPGPRGGGGWSQGGGGVPGAGGCTWSQRGRGLVPGGGGVPGAGGVPGTGGCTWYQGVYLIRGVPAQVLPPVKRITDACENITLPQLRCGR